MSTPPTAGRLVPTPFRSLLYAPGDRPDLIDAAAASDADAIIFDLEDRVAPERKAAARRIVRGALESLGPRRIVYVRINPLDSGLARDDLDAVAVPGLAGIRVPKVGSEAQVRAVDALLTEVEAANGLSSGCIGVSLGLESAEAVALAFELCAASPRVTSVGPGLGLGGDLQRDVGYEPTEEGTETLYIRSKVVLDARRAGVPIPLDGGFGTYGSYDPVEEGAAFERSVRVGRQLGYRGKICFHPAQAALINQVFERGTRRVSDA